MLDTGFSIEWHDFHAATDVDWAKSFHPDSLELCLNLAGRGEIQLAGRQIDIPPRSWTFYFKGEGDLSAWRLAGEQHQFMTLELSRAFLSQHLTGKEPRLNPLLANIVSGKQTTSGLGPVSGLRIDQERWVLGLQHPPVVQAAQRLWYEGKALELLADFLFQPAPDEELFCERQKRLAHDRVQRASLILRENLAAPPDLEELGRKVGCSPFYLSRTFSAEMGMTIPQYLRQIRMERAAELLRSGKFNVTEAALEVGYSSLSHFSQAFHQTFGCCPGLFPVATLTQKIAQDSRDATER